MLESLNMELKDWITIGAVILGPVLAVQAQKFLEIRRDRKRRRLHLFKVLMSTRGERLSREHVQALNMIDIEFYGRKVGNTRFQTPKEKAVTNAWKNYNDSLNRKADYANTELWTTESYSLFVRLLYEMSKALGYDYDEVQIKRDGYRPEAHANLENAQLDVLEGLAEVLKQRRSIPMAVTYFPNIESAPQTPASEAESESNKSMQPSTEAPAD